VSVRFKQEVRIIDLPWQLVAVLRLAALWSLRSRIHVEINSIDDGAGVHMGGSLHGLSLAVDLDTVGDKNPDIEQLAEFLRRTLDPQYDLVFEGDHVHVEWDAHRPAILKRPT